MARALLLDLDGTLYTGGAPVPGAADAVAAVRARGIPCRFLTNTTSLSRAGLVARLQGYGFDAAFTEIVTPLVSATGLLRAAGIRTVIPFVPDAALEDLKEFDLAGGTAPKGMSRSNPSAPPASSALIVGDLGSRWTFDLMQAAFDALMAGARFIALSRDRYFQSHGQLRLDAGPFVAGLEYASGKSAEIVGKPSGPYYQQALASLGDKIEARDVVMVGDDLWSDIKGAQEAGYQGWLVRTGKFRDSLLAESGIVPDRIIDSAAGLAGLIQ